MCGAIEEHIVRNLSLGFGAFVMLASLASPRALGVVLYSLRDLGDIPGGQSVSQARAINPSGQVVGFSEGTPGNRAFYWDAAGGMRDLAVPPGGADYSVANGLNAAGKVVGIAATPVGNRAIYWTPSTGMQLVSGLPTNYPENVAYDINDAETIVGVLWTANGVPTAYSLSPTDGCRLLPTIPGADGLTSAGAINNNGLIVGHSAAPGSHFHAVTWDSSATVTDLGDLPGGEDRSSGTAINDTGVVVGYSSAVAGNRAFRWTAASGMIDLGDLPGGQNDSNAASINNLGQVVGTSEAVGGPRAFVWDDANGMQNLNSLLDSSGAGWTLTYGGAINDAGQIVGQGRNPNGFSHAFLLTPVPEPTTLMLPLLWAGLLIRRNRR
jgi:probable HAF family extracellular repeat protein